MCKETTLIFLEFLGCFSNCKSRMRHRWLFVSCQIYPWEPFGYVRFPCIFRVVYLWFSCSNTWRGMLAWIDIDNISSVCLSLLLICYHFGVWFWVWVIMGHNDCCVKVFECLHIRIKGLVVGREIRKDCEHSCECSSCIG